MPNCQRFSDISVSERILNTLCLLSFVIGYLFSLGRVFLPTRAQIDVLTYRSMIFRSPITGVPSKPG